MPKVKEFSIYLNTAAGTAVFYPGQMITGQLIVDLDEPMKANSVKLKFFGGATVRWTERHTSGSGKNRRTRTVTYSAYETYFNQTVVVFGNASTGLFDSSPYHPAGRHSYPFQFQLPMNLPSSFEGQWGHVRYSLTGCIDKPWKFDHNTKIAFTVLSQLDLNQQPNVRDPQNGQDSKTLCCLCCASGPITAKFSLDRRGYVPGEYITVNAEVINNSSRVMNHSKMSLVMVTTFRATSKSRQSEKLISELSHGAIEPGDTDIWRGERLHIPPVPPSYLVNCNIIDIQYYVKMVVSPNGPSFNLVVPLNLIVGTIPLQNIQSLYSASAYVPPAGFNVFSDTAAASAPPPPEAIQPQPSAPPPSYAQCVFGQVDIKDEGDNEYTRGNLNYAPTYTYYTWDQQPPTYNAATT